MANRSYLVLLLLIIVGLSSVIMSQGAHAASEMKYLVGLGDSRAAGAGLPMAQGVTKNHTVECKRSPFAAIAYLAYWTNTPVVSHACSGATTNDLYDSDAFGGVTVPAQINQVPEFVLTDKDTVFVVQTGPNDIRWTTLLTHCARNDCGDQRRETVAYRALLLNYERRLHTSLLAMREKGAKGHIIVTGVYNPAPNDPDLLKNYGISSAEQTWISTAINQFNSRTRSIASKHKNVSYASIELSPTELQSLQDKAPFHPNVAGQKSTARQIQSVLETKGYK